MSDNLLLTNVLILDPWLERWYWVVERLTQPIPGVRHVGELRSCWWLMRFSFYHYQTYDQVREHIPQTVRMTSNVLTGTGIDRINIYSFEAPWFLWLSNDENRQPFPKSITITVFSTRAFLTLKMHGFTGQALIK